MLCCLLGGAVAWAWGRARRRSGWEDVSLALRRASSGVASSYGISNAARTNPIVKRDEEIGSSSRG